TAAGISTNPGQQPAGRTGLPILGTEPVLHRAGGRADLRTGHAIRLRFRLRRADGHRRAHHRHAEATCRRGSPRVTLSLLAPGLGRRLHRPAPAALLPMALPLADGAGLTVAGLLTRSSG